MLALYLVFRQSLIFDDFMPFMFELLGFAHLKDIYSLFPTFCNCKSNKQIGWIFFMFGGFNPPPPRRSCAGLIMNAGFVHQKMSMLNIFDDKDFFKSCTFKFNFVCVYLAKIFHEQVYFFLFKFFFL